MKALTAGADKDNACNADGYCYCFCGGEAFFLYHYPRYNCSHKRLGAHNDSSQCPGYKVEAYVKQYVVYQCLKQSHP